jgi:hypothetical protein
MTQHRHFADVRPILVLSEGAAVKRSRTKQTEEIGAHLAGAQLLRHVPVRVVDDRPPERGHLLDDVRLPAPVHEFCGRGPGSRTLGRRVHEVDDAVRIRRRHRLQQNGVDDGKNGRVRADAERQRGDGRQRERRRLHQRANRVSKISQQLVHESSQGTET